MENIGRDFNKLDIAYGGAAYTLITNDDELAKRELKKISKDRKVPVNKLNYMIGNPSFIKELIQQYKKLGVIHIITGFLDFPSLASLKLLAELIIPSFK